MSVHQRKNPEDYRRLADHCREAARTASTEQQRADLLSKARTWNFLADRTAQAVTAPRRRRTHPQIPNRGNN